MKRTFEIEWPDEHGPMWMNADNLMICLTGTCPKTRFSVTDISGDMPQRTVTDGPTAETDDLPLYIPETPDEPICGHVYREAPNGNLRTYFNGSNAYHLCELCGHRERC